VKSLAVVAMMLLLGGCASTSADNDTSDDGFESPAAGATAKPPVPMATPTDPRVSELQVLVGELLDRIEVLNARISRLESGAPAPAPVRSAEPAVAVAEPPHAPQQPPATATAAARKPRRPIAAGSRGAELAEAYRGALELYGKGRIDDARQQFQGVFDADPEGDLADNALYWIAETYYSTGKFEEALKIYARVLAEYGDQNKAPDAMLKSGLSQAKLGDLSLARRTFEALIARYPYSTAAAAAKYELKRIKY
jgi:tol-pal system protein YbgF